MGHPSMETDLQGFQIAHPTLGTNYINPPDIPEGSGTPLSHG